jgi:hypothetical protein
MEAWWFVSCVTACKDDVAKATQEKSTSRLDEAGLLMEGAAADAPPPVGLPGLPAGGRPVG